MRWDAKIRVRQAKLRAAGDRGGDSRDAALQVTLLCYYCMPIHIVLVLVHSRHSDVVCIVCSVLQCEGVTIGRCSNDNFSLFLVSHAC
jgi:hypothetical protein